MLIKFDFHVEAASRKMEKNEEVACKVPLCMLVRGKANYRRSIAGRTTSAREIEIKWFGPFC